MSANHPQVEMLPLAALKPYERNARTHPKAQVKQLAAAIRRFGFTVPILIDDENRILAGHGRLEAARQLALTEVPCIRIGTMSEADKRAYVLADNRLAEKAGWNRTLLAEELAFLVEEKFEVELTGFTIHEVDVILADAEAASPVGADPKADAVPAPGSGPPVTRRGDVWALGRHRLICGDARVASDYDALMQGDVATMVFTDPPYNCPIDGFVCGAGSVTHAEFAMAAGEMSVEAFTAFLTETLGAGAAHLKDGGLAYACMDWRNVKNLILAGESVFTDLKQICVWNKTNGGQGSFYRSKHELVCIFKKGTEPHTNTFGLGGAGGRYRTNVWDYAGVNTLKPGRMDELAMHPTVKPVALIADAILDVTARGEIVLDMFGGSGSTLIAAEKTGRTARLIEYEPGYCDVILRRFAAYSGIQPKLLATGETFEVTAERQQEGAPLDPVSA